MQKKLLKTTPIFLFSYVLLQILLGAALLNGWTALVVLLSGLVFGMHRLDPRLRLLSAAVFLGNIAFMMTVMSWFRNIDAFGWQNIGPFSPNLVLMFALFIASAFCSIFVALFWLLLGKLMQNTRVATASLSYIYVWGLAMMLVEIIRALSFSLFVSHSRAPIEPSLNLFSAGPLIYGTPLGPLSRLFGFWGSSFLIFIVGSLLFTAVGILLARRHAVFVRRNIWKAAYAICVTAVIFLLSGLTLSGSQTSSTDFDTVAVSQQQNMTYLQELADQLSAADIDRPVVVVLPEYSALLHPYSDASLFNPTYDGREDLPRILKGKQAYLVGTEDELAKDGRYVETYVVNSELQKIKRSEKTFLIPGGEYIPPLISNAIKRIDQYAVINFSNSRSRSVLKENLPPDTTDPVARLIATGPCSAILTPFHFRKQVAGGAVLLTSNVSYEQFAHAPEYREYTHRFARFTAYSTARPFIIGARAGEAMVYSATGNVLAGSGDTIKATHKFENLSHKKTLYVMLGDTFIVGLLLIIGLLVINAGRLLPGQRIKKKNS